MCSTKSLSSRYLAWKQIKHLWSYKSTIKVEPVDARHHTVLIFCYTRSIQISQAYNVNL